MSRHCPKCGYPISGRPDYVDDYDPAAPENFDDPYKEDSVLGILGDSSMLIDEPRPWWRLW